MPDWQLTAHLCLPNEPEQGCPISMLQALKQQAVGRGRCTRLQMEPETLAQVHVHAQIKHHLPPNCRQKHQI